MISRATKGSLEIIYGSMFAGKTEELARRLGRLDIANRKYVAFKSHIDTRSSKDTLSCHNKSVSVECISVEQPSEIMYYLPQDTYAIAIDECQFFGDAIVRAAVDLAVRYRVICTGLTVDHRQQAFSGIAKLISLADRSTQLYAICNTCGEEQAIFSVRKGNNDAEFVVGGSDSYKVLCRPCLNKEEAGG